MQSATGSCSSPFEDNHVDPYSLRDDHGEQHDLAAQQTERATQLRARLHDWRKELGAQLPRKPTFPAQTAESQPVSRPCRTAELAHCPSRVQTADYHSNTCNTTAYAVEKRIWLRRVIWVAGAVIILLGVILLFWLRGALYNRFVSFPREEAAWRAIRAQRQPVADNAGWTEYRGILHTHSHLSHDSEVPFEEILRVLKRPASTSSA